MSSNVGSISEFVRLQLETATEDEKTGAQIGSNLSRLEDTLLELYAKGEWGENETVEQRVKYLTDRGLGNLIDKDTSKSLKDRIPSMEGIQKAVDLRYQRAVRAFEGFMTLMRNANEIIQRGIQNLRLG